MLRTLRALAIAILPLVLLGVAVVGAAEVVGSCEVEGGETVALASEATPGHRVEPRRVAETPSGGTLAAAVRRVAARETQAPGRSLQPLRFPLRL